MIHRHWVSEDEERVHLRDDHDRPEQHFNVLTEHNHIDVVRWFHDHEHRDDIRRWSDLPLLPTTSQRSARIR